MVHVDEGVITRLGVGTSSEPCQSPVWSLTPSNPLALKRRLVEMHLSISHACSERGAERQPGFCQILRALLVFD